MKYVCWAPRGVLDDNTLTIEADTPHDAAEDYAHVMTERTGQVQQGLNVSVHCAESSVTRVYNVIATVSYCPMPVEQ